MNGKCRPEANSLTMYASKCWNTSRSPVDLLVKWVRNVLPLQMAFDWFVGGCLGSFPWRICGHHFFAVEHCLLIFHFYPETLEPHLLWYGMKMSRCVNMSGPVPPPPPKRTCKIYLERLNFTLFYLSFFSSNQLKGTVRTEDSDRRFFSAVTSKEMIFKPLRFCWSSRHSSFLAPSCGKGTQNHFFQEHSFGCPENFPQRWFRLDFFLWKP